MKRLFGFILTILFPFIQGFGQIESTGMPAPFIPMSQTYTRGSQPFFTTIDVDTTQTLQTEGRIVEVGHVAPVNFSTATDGFWTYNTAADTLIWRMGFIVPDAAAISLVLNQFDIPDGAKLFVYNPTQSQILGAFTNLNANEQGILPIRPLLGDSLIIEYQEPATATYRGYFGIESIVHNRSTNTFGRSNSCSPHANFTSDLPHEKRAVCLLYTISTVTNKATYSSGCLINNTAGKPYVYTAAHVLKSTEDATRTIFYFNYAVTEQDSTIQGTQECSIAGGVTRAWATGIDMALIELNQMPPADYQPYLAGWSRTQKPQAPLICIQHPNGDSKKMSYDNNNPVKANYGGYFEGQIPNGWWYIARWERGVTEAGSSGSPLFDATGRIIGALSGGSSFCNNPVADYFARLDTAWNHFSDHSQQLAHWLSPNDVHLQQMDGADPYELSCTRIKHIAKNTPLERKQHSKGHYAGHNQLTHTQFAEKFTTPNSKNLLYGAYVMPYKGSYNSSKPVPVYLTVYDGDTFPNNELARVQIRPRDWIYKTSTGTWNTGSKVTWSNKENYTRFSQPIEVPANFFVGVEIDYENMNSSDTLALYYAVSTTNTAYYFDGNTWSPYSSHSVQPANLSLWIEPVVASNITSDLPEDPAIGRFVYPNPTYHKVYFNCTDPQRYRLYNLQGQLLQQGTDTSVELPQTGMYLLQLFDEAHHCTTHKVIRQ